MQRLVLLGGGHAHVHVLDALGGRPPADVETVLISPYTRQVYSGMLPGWIAGHYHIDQCTIPLDVLAGRCGCRHVVSHGLAVDFEKRLVLCADGSKMAFDVLSIDVGPVADLAHIQGAEQFALPVRPLESFIAGWEAILAQARIRSRAHLAIIGGGAGGVELALNMQYRLVREIGATEVKIALVSGTSALFPGHAEGVRKRLSRLLSDRGIETVTGVFVAAVDSQGVYLANRELLPAEQSILATGAAAPQWPRESGLVCDEEGYILVNEHLQSVSHANVFAAGDVATMQDHPRPKSGVYAVRAGPPLAENLRRALRGETLLDYVPQRRALYLIGTGDRSAVASWGPLSWEGRWVWNWKDRIDRKFIARYQ